MYALEIRHKFDAMHQLEDSEYLVTKECARVHGHTYGVRVFIDDIKNEFVENGAGMVVDFSAVKKIIDRLDHRSVNEVFKEENIYTQPTAENIARYICEAIQNELGFVTEVWVAEGYKGEEWSSWAKYYTK
jgi:6-pyruvoyltetrahydropterin/6-carboxytetrahydropterin synthase